VKAVVLNEFGSPDQLTLTETTDPRPGPGDCLIAAEACDVLFLDTMLRSGAAPEGMEPELPWIPGTGVAGRVLAVGPDVEPTWQGARGRADRGRVRGARPRAGGQDGSDPGRHHGRRRGSGAARRTNGDCLI
jgi:NADPH:quinone reductase